MVVFTFDDKGYESSNISLIIKLLDYYDTMNFTCISIIKPVLNQSFVQIEFEMQKRII